MRSALRLLCDLSQPFREIAQHSVERDPRLRWGIGVLLGVGILINYFDRVSLSVAAPQLEREFALTAAHLGWLLSGFFWSYALLQIPVGMILDRYGVTAVNRASTFLWSVTCAATAFAGGFACWRTSARRARSAATATRA